MAASSDTRAKARRQMMREIEAEVRSTSRWIGRPALDDRVMAAMAKVPRHEFVPPDMESAAYRNEPLPIGFGQTISQPYIVALMTDLIAPPDGGVVLEVGTGCGYQTAVLAEVAGQVFTIEVVKELAEQAQARLARLHYRNVTFRVGDGYHGWSEHAPYDGIIVTAAANEVPPALIAQLKAGGRMAIPVGTLWSGQTLLEVRKDEEGRIHRREVLPVAFVPLTGKH